MNERFEIQRTIPSDAATLFGIVSDPFGHVAIDASGMLQDATGEPAGAVGDTFVIHMDREALGDFPMGKYDVTVTITAYEQDRFITWEVSGENFPSIGHYHGYRFEPGDGGTLVTSIYDWSNVDEQWKAGGHWPIISEATLKASLGILERTARARSSA
jgi:Polyketide cyclase / dehydrase and lipid transport